MELLEELVKKKLVDELVLYNPQIYTTSEKRKMVSKNAEKLMIGGGVETIGDQFFNELKKREIGRKKCESHGCSHFMSMDTDEFYLEDELSYVKKIIFERDYDATACR